MVGFLKNNKHYNRVKWKIIIRKSKVFHHYLAKREKKEVVLGILKCEIHKIQDLL